MFILITHIRTMSRFLGFYGKNNTKMLFNLSQLRLYKNVTIRKFRYKDKSIRNKIEITCPEISHGEIIKDRKSSFQGHAAEVHNIEDINAVLAKLMQNRKIYEATHNILAYRIEQETAGGGGTRILEGCDDDGEAHAGTRMLRLLQLLDQRKTLVVVSRWYGGIQLGPDRFRHINDAAKQAIEKAGLLNK